VPEAEVIPISAIAARILSLQPARAASREDR
jgi:hypothetical protein